MLRGISDAVGAAGLAAVAPPPLAFLLSTLELLLPLHTALVKSKTPPPWQCPSSPLAPPQGAPGGLWAVGNSLEEGTNHWAPRNCH